MDDWKLELPTLESREDFGAYLGDLYAFNFADSTVLCLFLEQKYKLSLCIGPVVRSIYQSLCGEIVKFWLS